ncbi:MAG TPA: insulinase family protein, partial [Chromatiales bacterium]|nr:insulinase family protein [Chromatiales bacterium]
LEVLAGVLSGSGSARLPRELVREQQVAASADASYDLYSRLADIFVFDAIPAEGHRVEEVERAWQAQVQRLKTSLVGDDELARIKAQVVADKIYEQDSVFYQAMQMGILETVGLGWQRLEEYPARIRAVTAAQVQAVAEKYLVDDQLTIAVLEPLPLDGKQQPAEH